MHTKPQPTLAINQLAPELILRLMESAADPAQACLVVAEGICQQFSARNVLLQRKRAEGDGYTVFPEDQRTALSRLELQSFFAIASIQPAPVKWQAGDAPPEITRQLSMAQFSNCLVLPLRDDSTVLGTLVVFDLEAEVSSAIVAQAQALLLLLTRILVSAENRAEERQLHMAMLAVQNTAESIYWLDIDGHILYVNPAAEKELGYSAAELKQMRVSDIDPNVPPKVWGQNGELTLRRRAGQMRNFKTQHRHRDGRLIPVEINSAPFDYDGQSYSMAICSDVSERLRAEEALRASQEKFSTIFSLTPDPLALVRLRDGVLLEVSHSYAAYFGYTREEMLGHTTLLEPEGVGIWIDVAQRQKWVEQLERNGEVLGYETTLRRKDGSIGTVLISGRVVDITDVHCVIVNLRDITRRKQMEELLRQEKAEQAKLIAQLEEAQNQLLQSEKLAAIGQLAAGVAHEINNPIGFIRSNLSTLSAYTAALLKLIAVYEEAEPALQDHAELHERIAQAKREADLAFLSEDMRNLIAESQEGAERVRHIVQDLRDFSRIDANEWQLADIHAGLESTINVVWNEIKYKAELVRDYGDLPPVECIPSRLNQVFMNLLVNAAQAMREHGKITISTRHRDNEVEISFTDTGQGIPADILPKIFNPFFTTKPVGKGTGLGLSVSYGIIRDHNGRIDVSSPPGAGATFVIHLPITRASPPMEAAASGNLA